MVTCRGSADAQDKHMKPDLYLKQLDQRVNEIASRYFDPLLTETDIALVEFV